MTYTLPLPPSLNRTYQAAYRPNLRRVCFFMTKEASTWKKEAQETLTKSAHRRKPTAKDVEVFITWFLKRDRDCDGGLKLVLDALQGTLIDNDRQVLALHAFKEKAEGEPHCEIDVFEL